MADVDNRNRNRRSNRAGQPNPKREARAKAAERHVATVSEACTKDIERSLAGVREFDGMPAGFVAAMKAKVQSAVAAEEQVAEDVEGAEAAEVEAALEPVEEPAEEIAEAESAPAEEPAPVLPEVTVLDASATQAILDNGRGYAQFCDMAVLAFASFTNPGGGYIQGYLGQEATLCADSYLYNVLDKQRKWYGENRRRNINCELYRNRALVVPAVRFDRNHVHAYADVIVAAAPNVKRARQEYRVSDDALLDALRDRIRFVLAICDELGREKLVLGAWGCDNNGFDAEAVAELFRKELASGDFKVKQVFFAVPSTRWDEDFAKFEHVLANFPERNEESYAQVAARAAAARAAEQTVGFLLSGELTMKNVLCFGDSNTYGYDPAGMRDGTAVRYAQDVRWCGVAQRDLGEGWHVIEEGLNGRTTVRDDMCHLDTNLNGIRALPMLLEAHKPLDAIVIMLGTNDCKTVFNVTAADIARGAMALIRAVRAFPWTDAAPCPRILLMAPIKIKPQIADVYMTDFDERSVEASEHFGEYYAYVAEQFGCDFLNAAEFAEPGDIDYLHMMPESHESLGHAVAAKLQEMLGE